MWQRMILIGLAGALGTLARYSLSDLVQRASGGHMPWGTLVVNVLGCFLFGLVWALADERMMIGNDTRIIVLGGFMGAFTTFSTFIFDTGSFMQDARWLMATGHMLLQTGAGLVFLFAGIIAGRGL